MFSYRAYGELDTEEKLDILRRYPARIFLEQVDRNALKEHMSLAILQSQ